MRLLLLPGLDGTGRLFQPLLEALPPTLTAKVVSYPPEQPLGYADLLPMVEEAANDLGDFIVLGESFSGPLALMLAAKDPVGLRGVVLCASFIRSPIPGLSWLKPLLRGWLFRMRPLWLLDWLLLVRRPSDELRSLLHEAVSAVPASTKAARVRAIAAVDASEELRQCRVPILYLRATEDRVVGRWNGDQIKTILPDAEIVEFAAPHLLLQTRPVEAAAAIEAFCKSCETMNRI
jgi:pimeloyl-[acyl-carrier protein] methyl ester esterase